MSDDERPNGPEAEMPTVRDALIGAAIGALILYGGTWLSNPYLRWILVGVGIIWVLVMLSYVAVVLGGRLRPKVVPRIKKVRGHTMTDPVLGLMQRDVRSRSWTATPVAGLPAMEFQIEGERAPHPELLMRARETATRFDSLVHQVAVFVADEARREEADSHLIPEIKALQIRSVVYLLDDHPQKFFIELQGPDEDIYWRCDCVGGQLRDLDFD